MHIPPPCMVFDVTCYNAPASLAPLKYALEICHAPARALA